MGFKMHFWAWGNDHGWRFYTRRGGECAGWAVDDLEEDHVFFLTAILSHRVMMKDIELQVSQKPRASYVALDTTVFYSFGFSCLLEQKYRYNI